MNPIFILLGLLGATAFSRSSSSSDTTDPLTVMGLSAAPDEDEAEDDDTGTAGAVVVGSTVDAYDGVVTPAETEAEDVAEDDADDNAEDDPEDDPIAELDGSDDENTEDTNVPTGFELIFDDLVVAEDEVEAPVVVDAAAEAEDEEPVEDVEDTDDAPVEDVSDETEEVVAEETVEEEVEEPVEAVAEVVEEAASDEPEDAPVEVAEEAPEEEVVEEAPVEVVEEAPEEEVAEEVVEEEVAEEVVAEAPVSSGSSNASAPDSGSDGPLELDGFASAAFSSDLDAPIVFQFSEDIQLGDGGVELRVFGEDGYETVERIGNDGLEVSGNQLLVSPRGGLDPLRDYAINLEPGSVETSDGDPFEGFTNDTFSFTSGIGIEEPEIDFSQYDTIIDGATFNDTLFLDNGDSNTLIINSTFENIDGSAIMIRNVENVTIANSTFRDIEDFGILLRSSGSSDGVTITGNTFEDVGGDAIHAAKRFADDVDHTNLIVHDNDLHDVASDGFLYHGIYVQSSEAVVWGNELTGSVGANGISIRGDGIVYDNYVDVTSGREFGSGIKYFSDHLSGDSSKLVIADNVVEGNNLHSGIRLEQTSSNQPGNISDEDWVVNDFVLLRNDVGGRNDYVFDSSIENAPWATIEVIDDAPASSSAASVAAFLPELPVEDVIADNDDVDAFDDALIF